MFQPLRDFLETPDEQNASRGLGSMFEADRYSPPIESVGERLFDFAFAAEAEQWFRDRGLQIPDARDRRSQEWLIRFLLDENGLSLAGRPKGLVPFHLYSDGVRTPLEEHLVEAARYAAGLGGVVRLHFTAPPAFRELFLAHLNRAVSRLGSKGQHFEITVSAQYDGSDRVVFDDANRPARDASNRPLRRPAGHGALLTNLAELNGDIIFLRTIDNVLPDRLKPLVCNVKEVLGGYLLMLEKATHSALKELAGGACSLATLLRIERFVRRKLCSPLPLDFPHLTPAGKANALFQTLNRPLRVCGVTTHSGLPGGSPFWTRREETRIELQIVEPCEVNLSDPQQASLWNASKFFNPVDMVCSVRNHLGRPFELLNFRDPAATLVAERLHGKAKVRVVEEPGLWNGGMAYWNTVFVKVPRATAAPVKSVIDLLNPSHMALDSPPSTPRCYRCPHHNASSMRTPLASFDNYWTWSQ
jgi:hypothetical protein